MNDKNEPPRLVDVVIFKLAAFDLTLDDTIEDLDSTNQSG